MIVVACSSAPSGPPPSSEPVQADAAHPGTITGRVVMEGPRPSPGRIRLDGDPQCLAAAGGESLLSEDIVLGDGNALQNVFVYVKQGLAAGAYAPLPDPVVLDQQKCRYVPHVLGVQVGQPLIIRNSDPLLHTVRADAALNDRFNVGTPVKGMEITRTFRSPEVMVPVGCDMHPWMKAYIGVLDHPFFAVTNASGDFVLAALPPGRYTIEVWHERLGIQSQDVVVAPGGTSDARFVYTR